MLYPVYVEMGDEDHAHGMVIPDFPGCFSASDAWETIPARVQEAIEVWMDGESIPLPKATPLEALAQHPDYQYGGVWMLIEVESARLRPVRSRRVNITLPEDVLERIDRYSAQHHLSRSGFLAKAAEIALRP
jgi:predicted RNase H-like HicB family nuclease